MNNTCTFLRVCADCLKVLRLKRLFWWFCTQVVLIHVGVTSVIAHIKIGQMHAALESKVLVVSAQGQSAKDTGCGLKMQA